MPTLKMNYLQEFIVTSFRKKKNLTSKEKQKFKLVFVILRQLNNSDMYVIWILNGCENVRKIFFKDPISLKEIQF